MKIEVNRWYRVLIDGQEQVVRVLIDGQELVVRVDGRIMKWCVVDYYDARLCAGSLGQCKKFIAEHIQEGIYDKEGAYHGN